MKHCATCTCESGQTPAEPPIGTVVRDKHGSVSYRHSNGGWSGPGMAPLGRWKAMWETRGPYQVLGDVSTVSVWTGEPLSEEQGRLQAQRIALGN